MKLFGLPLSAVFVGTPIELVLDFIGLYEGNSICSDPEIEVEGNSVRMALNFRTLL